MIPTTLNEDLLDVPDDADLLEEALAKSQRIIAHRRRDVADAPTELHLKRLGRELQRYSEYLRLRGDFDAALQARGEALAIWQKFGSERAHFLCRLHTARIHFHAGRADIALASATALLEEMSEKTSLYEDFIHEAIGRSHHLLHSTDAAIHHLERALQIRIERGNERHISQTREMLEIARLRLKDL